MLALCQQIEENLIQEHQNVFLLVVQSREIFVSRDVVFYEHVFSYQRVQDTSNETNSPDIDDQILFAEDL